MTIRAFGRLAALALLLASPAVRAVPSMISYLGELRADNGLPYTGEVDVTVALFAGASGGAPLWTDALGTQTAMNGLLDVELSGAGLPALLAQHDALWLEFTIDGETLSPRQRLTSVPYAHVAGNAQMLGGMPAASFLQAGDGIGALDLPTNAIGQVSNGSLANEFMDVTKSWTGGPANILDAEPISPPPPATATVATGEGAGSYLTGFAIHTNFGLNFSSHVRMILTPPAGSGVAAITLRDAVVIQGIYDETWDVQNTPELAAFLGTELGGTWTLTVADLDNNASGTAIVGQLTEFEVLYDVVRADHLSVNGRLDVDGPLNVDGPITATGPVTAPSFVGDGSMLTGVSKIRNITVFDEPVRKVLGQATSQVLTQFTVDKKSSTSYLLVDGTISGFGLVNSAITQGWKYGNGNEVVAQAIQAGNSGSAHLFGTRARIDHTTTGPQMLTLRYFTVAGGASQPFSVYNPNGADDNRLAQTRSVYVVWEIEP